MVIIILIAITLILTAAVLVWNTMDKNSNSAIGSEDTAKPISSQQVKDNTVIVKEIVTNLNASSTTVIRVSLAFQLENEKTKKDFENLLESYVKGTIIQTLNDLKVDQIKGKQGSDDLAASLMNQLNPLFQNGKIKRIDVTDKVIN
ncbi:flagellar basal body protein FliL [Paenibacillus albiflavus]|uniref:Flagellar protein FliL n=2 Tax=Paenibacillus albiflavus TaxID=2545760 RepID=A0A4V2WPQ2_9BACL|nr:flagellar basal body protein FliL [Paenibacillus albiflavus]